MTESEFLKQYGDVKVKLTGYYKYTFSFRAELDDGSVLSISVGGSGEQIYKMEIVVDKEVTVAELFPYAGEVTMNGKTINSFFEAW